MRIKDLVEAKKQQPIKARDPNWRDMEALRRSGAAGSHGDKTKTIPRKEKYKKISMEDQFQAYMDEQQTVEGGKRIYIPDADVPMPRLLRVEWQPDVTRALRKAAGLPDSAYVYFDDADLVYGSKTVWPMCGVDDKCTFGDAVKALKKFVKANPLGEDKGSLDQFRNLYRKSIGSDDDAVTLRELIKVINDDSLWSDEFPQLKQFTGISVNSGSRIVTAKKIPGDTADEKINTLIKAIDDDKWVDDTAKHLMRSYTLGEDLDDDYGYTWNCKKCGSENEFTMTPQEKQEYINDWEADNQDLVADGETGEGALDNLLLDQGEESGMHYGDKCAKCGTVAENPYGEDVNEADPDTLGKMNDKMRDVLSKVDTDDKAKIQAAKDKAEAERQAKMKELGPDAMNKYIDMLKKHDWTYQYSDDHRYYVKGSEEDKAIRALGDIVDPDRKLYKQYSPFFDDKPEQESIHTNYKVSDIFKALDQVDESITVTSAGDVGTVVSPHIAIGDKKTRKKYGLTGGLPNPPKAKRIDPKDNALNMKGTSIFGGPLKRS